MNKIKHFLENLNDNQTIIILSLIGCGLAILSNFFQHDWINVDSLLYFESARLISIGEWKEGIAIYNWPLYSTLISLLSKATTLSIQHAAQVWNIIFFTVTVFSLSKIIYLAGGVRLTIICGVFLLLSSSYISGSALPMLLRDQGFWAAFLTSIIFFIRFYRSQKFSDAFLWQIAAIIATLFRIEAITYLTLLPTLLLFNRNLSWHERIKSFIKINTIPIFAAILLMLVLAMTTSIHLADFGRLQEAFNLAKNVADAFNLKATNMNKLLGEDLEDYGLFSITVSLFAIFIFKACKLVSWQVIGIFIISRTQTKSQSMSNLISKDVNKILITLLLLSSINPLASIARSFVLSSRYLVAFALIAFIFAAFHLARLLENIKGIQRTYKLVIYILIGLLTASLIHNFSPKKSGHHHEKDAISYIQANHIPNTKVFYTTPKSIYYAGLPYSRGCEGMWTCIEESINNGSALKYDYLLIYLDIDENLSEKEKALESKLADYEINKTFYGLNNKKKLVLYSRKINSAPQ